MRIVRTKTWVETAARADRVPGLEEQLADAEQAAGVYEQEATRHGDRAARAEKDLAQACSERDAARRGPEEMGGVLERVRRERDRAQRELEQAREDLARAREELVMLRDAAVEAELVVLLRWGRVHSVHVTVQQAIDRAARDEGGVLGSWTTTDGRPAREVPWRYVAYVRGGGA